MSGTMYWVAVGFCFGGTTCLELARSGAPVQAIVTFHAGLNAGLPDDAQRLRARVLICHGAEDPLVKQEQIEAVQKELRASGCDWEFTLFGNALHGFTNPKVSDYKMPGLGYNESADKRSWQLMTAWFSQAFAN